jgi:hypothetical protein
MAIQFTTMSTILIIKIKLAVTVHCLDETALFSSSNGAVLS